MRALRVVMLARMLQCAATHAAPVPLSRPYAVSGRPKRGAAVCRKNIWQWSNHGERGGRSLGNARNFDNGRQFATWLGLVPGQHSTGVKLNLLKFDWSTLCKL